MKDALRNAVRVVALLNLAYFGVEFSVALLIGSVALFADSIDFLEDASLNALILLALAWGAPRRAVVSKVLAGIILIPGLATVWMTWEKFAAPMPQLSIQLGHVFLTLKDHAGAKAAFARALALAPNAAGALWGMGKVHQGIGENRAAIDRFVEV